MPKTRAPLFVVAAIALSVRSASAQTTAFYDQAPIKGIIRNGPATRVTTSGHACPGFVVRAPRQFENMSSDSTPVDERCFVDTVYDLPTADGARWMAAVYRRVYIVPSDSISIAIRHATRDTGILITGVLYAAGRGDSLWRPAWMGIVDRSMTWSITPTLGARPDGSALVSVSYCVNGTGGCWQSYLRRRSGNWTAVTEAFWNQLAPIGGGRIGKGSGIDVTTLKGSYGLYGQKDGNCCPSRELLLTLDQRGDSLILKSHRIRRVEQ